MRNRLTGIIRIYPIRKIIFLCLKPSDIHRICDATEYKLTESEEKIFMNPHDEICKDDIHPHTTLFTGDSLSAITNYNCIHRSLHMYEPIKVNVSEDDNIAKFKRAHIYRENIIFKHLSSVQHINMTGRDTIFISSSISSLSSSNSSYINSILNSYELTRIEFFTAIKKESNYETTQFSLPCIISTEKEWYYDMFDIEFKDVTISISATNHMLDMLRVSIQLRSRSIISPSTQTYTTERTRAIFMSRPQELI